MIQSHLREKKNRKKKSNPVSAIERSEMRQLYHAQQLLIGRWGLKIRSRAREESVHQIRYVKLNWGYSFGGHCWREAANCCRAQQLTIALSASPTGISTNTDTDTITKTDTNTTIDT